VMQGWIAAKKQPSTYLVVHPYAYAILIHHSKPQLCCSNIRCKTQNSQTPASSTATGACTQNTKKFQFTSAS